MQPPTLGERIRELRKRSGLTQQELADRCGCHVQSVSRWERGDRMPRSGELAGLGLALGVSTDLFFDQGPSHAGLTELEPSSLNPADITVTVASGGLSVTLRVEVGPPLCPTPGLFGKESAEAEATEALANRSLEDLTSEAAVQANQVRRRLHERLLLSQIAMLRAQAEEMRS